MNVKVMLLLVAGVLIIGGGTFFTYQAVGANSIDSTYQKAVEAYKEESYKESAELFEAVIRKEPGHVDARLGLADVYIAMGGHEQAVQTLTEGFYETPDEERIYLRLADIHFSENDARKGYEVLQKGMELSPGETQEIQKAMKEFEDNLSIQAERKRVQKDHSMELALTWENPKGEATPLEADWSIENENTSELQEGTKEVSLQAAQLGEVEVSAAFGSYKKIVTIEVVQQLLHSIEVTPEEIDPLSIGESVELTVKGFDADANDMEIKPEWSIAKSLFDINIRPDQTAVLTAQEEGKDTLTIKFEDFEEQMDVFVEGANKYIQTKVDGQGVVTVFPNKENYTPGEDISIEASPATGYEFVRWEGDVSGASNPQHMTIEDHMRVTAVFEPIKHNLALSKEGQGDIYRDTLETTFAHMEKVSLRARPKEGWTFVGWEGALNDTNPNLVIEMDADKSLHAVFKKKEQPTENDADPVDESQPSEEPEEPEAPATYQLNIKKDGEGHVQKNPSGSQFNKGTKVQLTAVPAEGWVFNGWSGSVTHSSTNLSVTMNGNKTVTAHFKKKPEPKPEPVTYMLNLSVVGEGTVQTSQREYKAGQTAQIQAVPAEGWTFVRWKGSHTSTSASASILMDTNKDMIAVFEEQKEETAPE
ncbi:InlB B-repeat-containing protein [Halobacillus faecis]|uniref:Bacterial repeat domain-containing protein n=1 Tax=Halobacillus faecis TaxID=360184 RepID=A0A511WU07_9BACI|nr:tetratricopeptide repeat protein [Halobacillus faecis]GEN54640.1 hypothetical protein HFA01_29020 [Halobacillus faecis]